MLSESFGHAVFKDSVRRVFHSGDYDLGLSSKYSFMNFVLYFFLSRIADYPLPVLTIITPLYKKYLLLAKLIDAYMHGADSLFRQDLSLSEHY